MEKKIIITISTSNLIRVGQEKQEATINIKTEGGITAPELLAVLMRIIQQTQEETFINLERLANQVAMMEKK